MYLVRVLEDILVPDGILHTNLASANLDQLTDAQLVDVFQGASDNQAKQTILEIIYHRYKGLILSIAYDQVRDFAQAKDIHHDVFIKVLENLHLIRNPNSFRSWMLTITKNLCSDFRRRKDLTSRDGFVAELVVKSHEKAVVDSVTKDKIKISVDGCLKRLDPFDLNVFKLRGQGCREARIREALNLEKKELRNCYDRINRSLVLCMEMKGYNIDINEMLSMGEQCES